MKIHTIHNHVVSFKRVMDKLKVYLLGHSAKGGKCAEICDDDHKLLYA